MRLFVVFVAAVFVSGMATAQPVVAPGGILNSASAIPAGISPGIAQGSIFSVYGSAMGPSALASAPGFPLPAALASTSIQVMSGGVTTAAFMLYTVAGQLAAILPSTVPAGPATLTVTYNNETSAPVSFTVVPSAFGAYALNSAGSGAGVFTTPTYQVYGADYAAQPGETVTMWGTGLGPVSGDEASGPLPGNQPDVPLKIYVGGQSAAIAYQGRSGCCGGLDQIAFVIPPGMFGCNVPVVAQIGDTVSNFVTIPIASGSRTCSDPTVSGIGTTTGESAVSIGSVVLSRTTVNKPAILGASASTNTSDLGSAAFERFPAQQPASVGSLLGVNTSTFGTCTVYYYSGTTLTVTISGASPMVLDAGPQITVVGPNGTEEMTKGGLTGFTTGFYSAQLGGGFVTPPQTAPPLYLSPGSYTVSGSGGTDVGAFSASFTVPPLLTWTNESAISTITREQGQLVTWSGGDPDGMVLIVGVSEAAAATPAAGAGFSCTAKNSDGQFLIPPVVLLSLPIPSYPGLPANLTTGVLSLGSLPSYVPFTAPGIDAGLIGASVSTLISVGVI